MKKKGFTLVELLAVIALLAILVIMALPAVLRMYRQSRINNFQNEVRSVYRTAQSQFLSDSMLLESGGTILYTNGCNSEGGVDLVKELEMTGNSNFKYYVLIDVAGKIIGIKASNGTYSYYKTGNDLKIEDIDVETNNEIELDSNIADSICSSSSNRISVGDEITFGSEHFYVVSTNSIKTVLLSKYNLLVGDNWNTTTGEYTPISTSTSGYGLQSSTAKGWVNESGSYVGVVPFSGTNYWDDGEGNLANGYTGNYGVWVNSVALPEGGNPYPYIYRSNMTTAPVYDEYDNVENNGYTIAYYVEQYVNKLKSEKGLPSSATGRLLSTEEYFIFINIPASYDLDIDQCHIGTKQIAMSQYGLDDESAEYAALEICDGNQINGTSLSAFINLNLIGPEYYDFVGVSNVTKSVASQLTNSSFWLGSAFNKYGVWISIYDGRYGYSSNNYAIDYGVRPVIVVNTSDL